ncbi:MAG TPA: PfkB family carbohydrate kinase [Bryobacteraceae bacterium]|jgi:D-beta-D-heptose 7-phosphate kinase/D-beta-D-heptose 1-phosphate adenosyltransferase
MSQRRRLIPFLEGLDTAVVGCAGDIMLDRFVYGSVNRISPEAPIPVLHVDAEQSMLGGLGNVVRNLGALDCGIRLFSITGEDPAGAEVKALVENVPRCEAYLLTEASRRTPVKVRYIAHGQQLLRADHETTELAGREIFESLLTHFKAHVAECSIVFLSDYAKGMLQGSHAQAFIRIARTAGKPVVVDPKGQGFERYRFATVIKPNLKELAEATGLPIGDAAAQELAARKLLDLAEAQFILVTRGPAGMLLVPRDEPRAEFCSLAREVYDVSGAGDTVAAVLAAALGSGAGIREAVELANIAAGIVVGRVGTAVVSRSEIIDEIEHESAIAASGKILRPAQTIERVRAWRRMGRRVGFTHGSFDPLSSEHLESLERERSRCDRLVVGLTTRNGAGPEDRHAQAFLLASLVNVDAVVICDSQTPEELMEMLGESER